MPYTSPFHYLPQDAIKDIALDASKIRLVRKKLLAEIELSETQSIFINGKELTKFDVLNLFDNLNDSTLLNIHAEIFKDKALLDFLENGKFNRNSNDFYSEILLSDFAIKFISPYYKEVSQDLLVAAFAEKDAKLFKSFFSISHLMNNENTFELYEYLTKKMAIISDTISLLEKKVEENIRIENSDIENLQLYTIVDLLNTLPDDFSKLRENVAFSLNALGCDLINESYNQFAITLFSVGKNLYASEYIIGYLTRNLKIAKDSPNKFPTDYDFKSKTINALNKLKNKASIIIVVFFISIKVLTLIFSGSNSNSSSTSSNNSSNNKNNTYTIDDFNYDSPTDPVHYPTYSTADTSFYDLMLMLYRQDDHLVELNYKPIIFNKGENVFDSLFQDSTFLIKKSKFSVGSASLKKAVLYVNKSAYQCILIIRNSTIKSDDELITESFTSKYIPSFDSVEVEITEGFNDIRPYMGKKLVENTYFKRSNFNSKDKDFMPKYLFETVPRNNILSGVGIKFEAIRPTNAKIIIAQDSTGELYQEIGYFLL